MRFVRVGSAQEKHNTGGRGFEKWFILGNSVAWGVIQTCIHEICGLFGLFNYQNFEKYHITESPFFENSQFLLRKDSARLPEKILFNSKIGEFFSNT